MTFGFKGLSPTESHLQFIPIFWIWAALSFKFKTKPPLHSQNALLFNAPFKKRALSQSEDDAFKKMGVAASYPVASMEVSSHHPPMPHIIRMGIYGILWDTMGVNGN